MVIFFAYKTCKAIFVSISRGNGLIPAECNIPICFILCNLIRTGFILIISISSYGDIYAWLDLRLDLSWLA